MTRISNSHIAIEVSSHGAEMTSLVCYGKQLLWHADPAFWRRHAPILFPIVGKVCNNTYRVGNQEYHLPQHGFARDSEFRLVEASDDSLTFLLESSSDTLLVYPYPFRLQAHYSLHENEVCCEWTVCNMGETTMYFQIGAHPAFVYPDYSPENDCHGYLKLMRQGLPLDTLQVTRLSPRGHALPETYSLPLAENLLPITRDLFAHDALVLEDGQADTAVLLDRDGHEVLSMTFDAPVLGLWSPVNAPFCCIEPWYGRTDSEGFKGTIDHRQHINALAPNASFVFRYRIRVCSR